MNFGFLVELKCIIFVGGLQKKRGGGTGLILKNLCSVAVTETCSSNLELGTSLSTCLKMEKSNTILQAYDRSVSAV